MRQGQGLANDVLFLTALLGFLAAELPHDAAGAEFAGAGKARLTNSGELLSLIY
jgi:hypothetical protein